MLMPEAGRVWDVLSSFLAGTSIKEQLEGVANVDCPTHTRQLQDRSLRLRDDDHLACTAFMVLDVVIPFVHTADVLPPRMRITTAPYCFLLTSSLHLPGLIADQIRACACSCVTL